MPQLPSASSSAVSEIKDAKQGSSSPKPLDGESQAVPAVRPPDEGVMPWVQVAGSFCLMFASWGSVMSYGSFQQYYKSTPITGETSSSTIAWIGSLQVFLLMLGGALTGTLYDSGRFRAMLYVGSFLMVFGLMMTSMCHSYWQFILAQSICAGSGMGLVALGALATTGTWFVKRRGLAVGIGSTGASVGGIVMPIALRHLIPQVGFPWAVRVMAFIVAGILMLPLAVSQQRLRPNKRDTLLDIRSLLQIDFGLFWLSIFLAFMGFFVFFTFIESWAVATGLDTHGLPPYYILAITNAASISGRIFPNFLSDTIGPLNIQAPATLIAGVLVLAWIPAHSLGSVLAVSILYGFFSGSLVSLPPSSIASMTADMGELGGRIGMAFLAMAFGSLIGAPVAGAIVQNSGYDGARVYGGCMILAGAVVMFASRIAKTGPKLWVKG